MLDNRFECGCERGGDCTKTTMCAVQELADELAALETAYDVIESITTKYGALKSENETLTAELEQTTDDASSWHSKYLLLTADFRDSQNKVHELMAANQSQSAESSNVIGLIVKSAHFQRRSWPRCNP